MSRSIKSYQFQLQAAIFSVLYVDYKIIKVLGGGSDVMHLIM